jgi:hypothetical protein
MNMLKKGILKSYILFLTDKMPGGNWNGLTFMGTGLLGLGLPLLVVAFLLTPMAEKAYKEVEPPVAIGVSLSLMATPLGMVLTTIGPLIYLVGIACGKDNE